jgi:ATP-dependent Lhr-like helicase
VPVACYTGPSVDGSATSVLDTFHPAVAAWFRASFEHPTPAQVGGWPSIAAGRDTLIAAPTGSGKTLAAFLAALDRLVREGLAGELAEETRVVYVSPLKALSTDIDLNLQAPLRGIAAELERRGEGPVQINTALRTGDTPKSKRAATLKHPPHILVTTPESLYILLTSERGRNMLRNVREIVVDEIHALIGNRRGAHLALTVARLEKLCGRRLVRVGLSATQKPVDEVARFLVGSAGIDAQGHPDCNIVNVGHRRALDLGIEVPDSPLEAVMSHEVWDETYDRLAELIESHRTTLIFVNTRRLSERITRHLAERIGGADVASHHGSLARHIRHDVEGRLKRGELRCLVATASLELGIDIGSVDLVCQIGSTSTIATFLQRVGRSGHVVGGLPKGRLFPLSRDQLAESVALLGAVEAGDLDRLRVPEHPLDVMAQQIVAEVASEERGEDELFELVREAYPFRQVPRKSFDAVLEILTAGYATHRGRRGTHLHRDAVHRRLRPRRGARLAAITSGGAIPELADYEVVLEPQGTRIGSINEDFAIESMAGDIFQLGNASWRILKVEPGKVRVADAKGQPPTIPFWLGEAPSRSAELSLAVSELRRELQLQIESEPEEEEGRAAALRWLIETRGLHEGAAAQLVDYFATARLSLGTLPTQDTLILERFFDETGGTQLVLHAPFGSRLNRAWGLALRKCFCRSFNFELQAAATEDAIILSLGPTHSFPLEDVWAFLHSASVRDILVQALLDAPMFVTRWRWNATRSLAVLRMRGGKRVAPQLQRMQADDLLTTVFPDQVACLENIVGSREIPEHPLVEQTVRDCLVEAMDIDALEALLRSIESGQRTLLVRELTEPSVFSHEILNANPYAFLDDAPLEERRTQAVMQRRWLDPESAAKIGALDPDAIATVREQAWPDPRDAHELHDALLMLGFLTEAELGRAPHWRPWLEELVRDGRVTTLQAPHAPLRVAAERLDTLRRLYPNAACEPPTEVPSGCAVDPDQEVEEILVELVRSRIEGLGPILAAAAAEDFGLPLGEIEAALIALETQGIVMRGHYIPNEPTLQWCERGLLARIHRYTIRKLRREIEPVTRADLMRFLISWQRVDESTRAMGPEGLAVVLEQLEGFAAAASSWESEILPSRVGDYRAHWLDELCLHGRATWLRSGAPTQRKKASRSGPVRATPIALMARDRVKVWRDPEDGTSAIEDLSADARRLLELLQTRGAMFYGDLAASGLLPTQLEDALAELVVRGLAVSDGFAGLRALLVPADHRRNRGRGRGRRLGVSTATLERAGRWSAVNPTFEAGPVATSNGADPSERTEELARSLLRRWGVVFKTLLTRERGLPPWRDLLRTYRTLEARGEIRGGRFVDGFSGEQFALPEAVGSLRDVRRRPPDGRTVVLAGSDPLNLTGTVIPGPRVAATSGNRILFRDGVPIAVRERGEFRALIDLDEHETWDASMTLLRKRGVPSPAQPLQA